MFQDIFHPIPDLDALPEPATKSERLETIVANLEAQRNAVRSRILSTALEELKTIQTTADAQHAATMAAAANASPVESPSSMDATPNPGLTQFLSSMGSSTRSPGTHLSPHITQSSATAKNVPQATIPPEVQVALRTMRELEEYDANFAKLRAKYTGALERERQVGGRADDRAPQQRNSVAAGSGAERRRSSFASGVAKDLRLNAATPVAQLTSEAKKPDGDVDRERDPRRRRSSISAAEAAPPSSAGPANDIDVQRDPRRR